MNVEDGAEIRDRLDDNASKSDLVTDTLQYLSKSGVAVLRGVSRQAIANAYDQAKLPEPVAFFDNGRPLWLPSQFETDKADDAGASAQLEE